MTPVKLEEWANKVEKIWKEVKENIEVAQGRQRKAADKRKAAPPRYKEGDRVWLSSKNITTTRPSKKLDYKFLGPFEIEKVLGTNVMKLKLPGSMKIHPIFHVSLLKPYIEDPKRKRREPGPVTVEGQEEYEVERIVKSRGRKGYEAVRNLT